MWRDDKVAKLLEVRSEEGIQAQLLGAVKNEVPFRNSAEVLQKAGYKRTYAQCLDKIKAQKIQKNCRQTEEKGGRHGSAHDKGIHLF